jgi:GntR family transcriptional regulator
MKRSAPTAIRTSHNHLTVGAPSAVSLAALGTSRHRAVSLVLADGIKNGRYPAGTALPGEEALAEMFKVSRPTIRRAMLDLVDAQLVEKRHGAGTFVRANIADGKTIPLAADRFSQQVVEAGKLAVKVLEFGYKEPPAPVRKLLRIADGAPVQHAIRVRYRLRQPLLHLTTFVPAEIGRTFSKSDLETKPLYELLARAGKSYRRAEQRVGACLADPAVADALSLDVGAPLLFAQRVLLTGRGEPVEFLEIRASPQWYSLLMTWDAAEKLEQKSGRLFEFESTF